MKEANKYTEEERKSVKLAFRLMAATYRRHRRIALCCFLSALGALGFFGAVLVLVPPFSSWAALPFLACIAVYFGVVISMPRLVCPGCSHEIQLSFGQYCPDCGSRTLEPHRPLRSVRCTACGKSNLKGRQYFTTRLCTHCGVMLDENGICAFRGVIWVKGESV
jgi:hypothetical protein